MGNISNRNMHRRKGIGGSVKSPEAVREIYERNLLATRPTGVFIGEYGVPITPPWDIA